MAKNVIVLEQSNSTAPDDIDEVSLPRGYSVKEFKEVECDHPKTRYETLDDKVLEICQVCGAEESQEIETNLGGGE